MKVLNTEITDAALAKLKREARRLSLLSTLGIMLAAFWISDDSVNLRYIFISLGLLIAGVAGHRQGRIERECGIQEVWGGDTTDVALDSYLRGASAAGIDVDRLIAKRSKFREVC